MSVLWPTWKKGILQPFFWLWHKACKISFFSLCQVAIIIPIQRLGAVWVGTGFFSEIKVSSRLETWGKSLAETSRLSRLFYKPNYQIKQCTLIEEISDYLFSVDFTDTHYFCEAILPIYKRRKAITAGYFLLKCILWFIFPFSRLFPRLLKSIVETRDWKKVSNSRVSSLEPVPMFGGDVNGIPVFFMGLILREYFSVQIGNP